MWAMILEPPERSRGKWVTVNPGASTKTKTMPLLPAVPWVPTTPVIREGIASVPCEEAAEVEPTVLCNVVINRLYCIRSLSDKCFCCQSGSPCKLESRATET